MNRLRKLSLIVAAITAFMLYFSSLTGVGDLAIEIPAGIIVFLVLVGLMWYLDAADGWD